MFANHGVSTEARLCVPFVAALGVLAALWGGPATAALGPGKYCGAEGVWIQILGSGGGELDDRRAGASYLLWIDGKARLLVDASPGAANQVDLAGGRLADIDAVLLTQLHASHTADLPDLILGAQLGNRERPLPLYGPDGNEYMPSTVEFLSRLIGPKGAYPLLQDFLTFKPSGFRVKAHNAPATGTRPGTRFTNERMRISSIPVNHGPLPALAWRVQVGAQSMVFTGEFNNRKNLMPEFAQGTDALVFSHTIAEVSRGALRDLHILPSQIGRIAKQADARMVILGQRMNRTRGRESQTREAIETQWDGPLIYGNDLECWGL
ncbi:MAG: MBL fold metallo-hydrolase [Pseudomonadota bacterium]